MRPKAKHKLQLDRNRKAFTQTAKKQWQKSANYTKEKKKKKKKTERGRGRESDTYTDRERESVLYVELTELKSGKVQCSYEQWQKTEEADKDEAKKKQTNTNLRKSAENTWQNARKYSRLAKKTVT